PADLRELARAREGLDRIAQRGVVHAAGVEREGGAVPRDLLEALLVDVDRDDRRAGGAGDLHAESADAAGADEDREVAALQPGAADRLVGRGDRVGEDGEERQLDRALPLRRRRDDAEPACRNLHVAREAAVDVVAGEDLLLADRAASGAADVAAPA